MKCPLCGDKLKVVESRYVDSNNTIIRRRRCLSADCKGIFYTREVEVPFERVNKDFNKIQHNRYKAERRNK